MKRGASFCTLLVCAYAGAQTPARLDHLIQNLALIPGESNEREAWFDVKDPHFREALAAGKALVPRLIHALWTDRRELKPSNHLYSPLARVSVVAGELLTVQWHSRSFFTMPDEATMLQTWSRVQGMNEGQRLLEVMRHGTPDTLEGLCFDFLGEDPGGPHSGPMLGPRHEVDICRYTELNSREKSELATLLAAQLRSSGVTRLRNTWAPCRLLELTDPKLAATVLPEVADMLMEQKDVYRPHVGMILGMCVRVHAPNLADRVRRYIELGPAPGYEPVNGYLCFTEGRNDPEIRALAKLYFDGRAGESWGGNFLMEPQLLRLASARLALARGVLCTQKLEYDAKRTIGDRVASELGRIPGCPSISWKAEPAIRKVECLRIAKWLRDEHRDWNKLVDELDMKQAKLKAARKAPTPSGHVILPDYRARFAVITSVFMPAQ